MRLQLLLSILSLSTITAAGDGVGAWVGTKVFNFEKGIKEKRGDVNGFEKAKTVETKENLQLKSQEEKQDTLTDLTTPLNTQNQISTNEISETITDIKVEKLNQQQLLKELQTNIIQITKGENNETIVYTLNNKEEPKQELFLKQEKADPYKTSSQISNSIEDKNSLDEEEEQKNECVTKFRGIWNDGSLGPTGKPECAINLGTDGVINSSTLSFPTF